MDPKFQESRPIMPLQLTYVLSAVLIATVAFMAISKYALDTDMPGWAIPVVAVVFVVIIVLSFVLKLSVMINDDGMDIQYAIRKVHIPMDEFIDRRVGEMSLIKSYDNWNLKGVKHRIYAAIGEDDGVAMKLTGKRVLVLSSKDPQAIADLLPTDEE